MPGDCGFALKMWWLPGLYFAPECSVWYGHYVGGRKGLVLLSSSRALQCSGLLGCCTNLDGVMPSYRCNRDERGVGFALWSAQWCTQWQVEVPHTDTWSMLMQLCINDTAHTASLQTLCRNSYERRTMSKSLLIKSLYLSANVYLIYHKGCNKNSPATDIASPPPHWLLKTIFQVFLLQS